MRKKLTHVAVAGAIGLAGVTGAAVAAPGAAAAATGADSTVTSRLTAVRDALRGLVDDGTLTRAQADEVAATLDSELPRRGPGSHDGRGGLGRGGLDVAARAIGISEEALHTALGQGRTLARVAADEGVSKDALVAALVKAAQARLDAAVTDGRLTKARADERRAGLEERITELVDRAGLGRGPGGDHHHGERGGHVAPGTRPGGDPGSGPWSPSTSPAASPRSSATA